MLVIAYHNIITIISTKHAQILVIVMFKQRKNLFASEYICELQPLNQLELHRDSQGRIHSHTFGPSSQMQIRKMLIQIHTQC